MEYNIVGTAESDPLENKISNESPVGKAILASKRAPTSTLSYLLASFSIKLLILKSSVQPQAFWKASL